MNRRRILHIPLGILVSAVVIATACGGDDSPSKNAIVINDNGGRDYNPVISPANFVTEITNPFLSLPVGTTRVFEGVNEDGKRSRTELEVTRETKIIMGVTTTVLRDRAYLEDKLVEDTLDWLAQEKDGTVWYFGEDSKEISNDKVVSTEGSWEAGVKGAKPGVLMLGKPETGKAYRQEYLKGEAEGLAEVLSVNASVTIAQGTYSGCVQIKEWAPDEPEIVEHKFYCPGVGGLALTEAVAGESGRSEFVRRSAIAR